MLFINFAWIAVAVNLCGQGMIIFYIKKHAPNERPINRMILIDQVWKVNIRYTTESCIRKVNRRYTTESSIRKVNRIYTTESSIGKVNRRYTTERSIGNVNRYIDEQAPWLLKKTDIERMKTVFVST